MVCASRSRHVQGSSLPDQGNDGFEPRPNPATHFLRRAADFGILQVRDVLYIYARLYALKGYAVHNAYP